jgi:hypothetical protein
MSLLLARRRKRTASGGSLADKAPLTGNIGRIPSLPETRAENRPHIVPSGGNPEMLVRCQPGPLYVDGRQVEVVQRPRSTRQPRVLFVRDVGTRMCFVVEAYKVVSKNGG